MRITKLVNMSNMCQPSREVANIGCDVCPCCGERKSIFDWMEDGYYDRGIMGGIAKEYTAGVFQNKNMRIDAYRCYSCGAEWESDPYHYS